MGLNLATLALKSDATFVHLRHPATDELLYADEAKKEPVGIYVYGTASKQYRNAITAMQNRTLKLGKNKTSVERMREEAVELLVAVTEKAANLEYNDEKLESAQDFRDLYSDAAFGWLKDQVDAALGDASAFLSQ